MIPQSDIPNTDTGTWVCWSLEQEERFRSSMGMNGYILAVHLQARDFGGKDDRTLCGIDTSGAWTFLWHAYPPDQFIGCLRCMRSYHAWKRRHETP